MRRQETVLEQLVRDLPKLLSEAKVEPDFVFVTGDVAQSGQAKEYDRASEFFRKLLDGLGLDRDKLHLVPGNHDVEREKITRTASLAQKQLLSLDADSSSEFAEELGKIVGSERELALFGARMAAYCDFTATLLGPGRAISPGRPWRTETVDVRGTRVGVASLASAWVCGPDDAKGRILLGERQARLALEELTKDAAAFRIVLLHDPVGWLHEGEERLRRRRTLTRFLAEFRCSPATDAEPLANLLFSSLLWASYRMEIVEEDFLDLETDLLKSSMRDESPVRDRFVGPVLFSPRAASVAPPGVRVAESSPFAAPLFSHGDLDGIRTALFNSVMIEERSGLAFGRAAGLSFREAILLSRLRAWDVRAWLWLEGVAPLHCIPQPEEQGLLLALGLCQTQTTWTWPWGPSWRELVAKGPSEHWFPAYFWHLVRSVEEPDNPEHKLRAKECLDRSTWPELAKVLAKNQPARAPIEGAEGE
ncbi:MAG: metallophosphoesterase [Deltaproteobacteria bacterium]|nr:metallophosphoesterase [Deltaproteobacteria bacterium]